MKRDIFQNEYSKTSMSRIFFADIVCFLVISILSIGFCYAYFSDKVSATGTSTTAILLIDYNSDEGTSIDDLQVELNGAKTLLTATTGGGDNPVYISPGDTMTIKGKAVGTKGTQTTNVDMYVLGRLEVTTKDSSSNIIDTEVVWYNIQNGKALYVERGLFQVGASLLAKNQSQNINIEYEFEGDRYTNDYDKVEVTFSLHSHQADYLDVNEDYANYSSATTDSVTYTKQCIYATHQMTGRLRDVWEDADANVDGLTIDELETDSSGAYLINSCKDWMIIKNTSSTTNDYHTGKTFKLNAYLDFNNTTTAKTIYQLNANLDGQGYTISNWKDSMGLISSMYGNLSNVGVDGVQLSATAGCGVLVTHMYYKTIKNCFAVGASVYDKSISDDIEVTLSSNSENINIGGLVSWLLADSSSTNSGIIQNCYAMLNIQCIGGAGLRCGGIIGLQGASGNAALVEECYYNGNIASSNNAGTVYLGYIVGRNNVGQTNNCFAVSSSNLSTNYSGYYITGATIDNVTNSAYIISGSITDTTVATKTGQDQTTKTVKMNTFKSAGKLRDAFDWDTSIWATNIYGNVNELPTQRVFYNF